MTTIEAFPEAISRPQETDEDERYTTRKTLEFCRRLAKVEAFDLDVAACEEAHHAPIWYPKELNGLKQPWFGRVWCNPPYSDIEPWVIRAWEATSLANSLDHAELVAMLVPATRTEQRWWQRWIEPLRDFKAPLNRKRLGDAFEHCTASLRTFNLPGRPPFGFPGNPEGLGRGNDRVPFGCVLLLWERPSRNKALELMFARADGRGGDQ